MIRRYFKRTFFLALLLLALGAGVGLVAFQATDGQLLTVQTGSMAPSLPQGSLIAVRKVNTDDIQKGDVVTYLNPKDKNQTITHRVVEVLPSIMRGGKPYLLTKGDANATNDKAIPSSSVKGRVSAHLPYAGHGLNFVRHPIGLLLIIYVPALMVVIAEIRRLSAYYQSQRPYSLKGTSNSRPTPIPVTAKVVALTLVLVVGIAIPAKAAFLSRAGLSGNTISTARQAASSPPDSICTVSNSNDASVTNNNNQQATSGDALATGNTNAGRVTSGNASNTNHTTTNITQTNSTTCQ